MKSVRIIRIEQGAEGTFGVVTIDGVAFCVSLELPWRNNQEDISCIPAGQYYCQRHNSPRFGDTFLVLDVEDRDDILFHPGNWVTDTEGCLLLGQYWDKMRGDRAIKNSGKTFERFIMQFRYEYIFDLEITENL